MRIKHKEDGACVQTDRTPSLFICSPTYSGDVSCHFAISLIRTCEILKDNGIPYEIYYVVYDSLVARARNDLADSFLKSDCTHCLMADSDQGWTPEAVLEMLKLDKPFITGAVPGRKAEETYALKIYTNPDRTPKVNNEGLIYCQTNGVAFAMIKRTVFETIKNLKKSVHDPYPYFQHVYNENGDHFGEDTYFVSHWENVDNVFIYPNITFTHGPITANYHEFLLKQPKPKIDMDKPELRDMAIGNSKQYYR